MDKEIMEMLQTIVAGMEAIDNRITDEIRGVKIMIENDVGKRIESLFDGYKLEHEKQWELEHKVIEMEKRLECLEAKAG